MATAGSRLALTKQINQFLGTDYRPDEIADIDEVTMRYILDFVEQWGMWRQWHS